MTIRQTDRLFEYIMNASKDLIFIKDLEHRYVRVNPVFLKMLSKSQDEVIGKTDYDIFPESVAKWHVTLDLLVFEEKRNVENTEWIKDSEGKQYFLEIIKFPLYNEQGELIGLMGQSRDMTQRKYTEDRLQERDQYLNGLIEGMEQGLAVHEVIFNEAGVPCDYRFLEVNPPFEKMTGLSRSEVIGKTVLEILPETESYWIETYGEVALTGKSIRYENKSNSIGKTFSVYAFRPKVNQFAVLIEDVTERKSYEEALIQERLRAEHANLAKDQFLANMSHEIRTPINGIIGLTDLLRSTKLTEDQKLYLEMVKKSSQALVDVIEDILEYIGLSHEENDALNRPLYLPDLIEELEALYAFSMRQKGLAFKIHLEESCPPWIIGDGLKIKQILTNLIGNALKFTSKGSVDVRIFAIPLFNREFHIIFEVKDTGIGISSQVRESMFTLFEQGDSSIKKHYQGLGLGLSRVLQLCRTLAAEISVESELGAGSTFVIKIPLKAAEANYCEELENSLVDCSQHNDLSTNTKKSILVVEDDAVSRVFIELILKSMDYEVLTSDGGKSALKLLAERPIDLLVLDLHLPDIDGFEVTKAIRNASDEKLRVVPIVAVTSYANEANRAKSKFLGINDCLSKPINKAQLMPLIEKWILK